jgi:hypothetical protein
VFRLLFLAAFYSPSSFSLLSVYEIAHDTCYALDQLDIYLFPFLVSVFFFFILPLLFVFHAVLAQMPHIV